MEQNHSGWGFHAFLRGIILFGFSMLMLSMIITGNIKYYIAPKMLPFIYFAMVVFLLLSVVQIIRSTPRSQEEEVACQCDHSHEMKGSVWLKTSIYALFLLPLLTGFILPDKTLDSSVASKRGVTLSTNVKSTDFSTSSTAKADEYLKKIEEGQPVEHFKVEDLNTKDGFDDYYSKLSEELLKQEILIIEDENFLDVMTVLDLYIDDFVGKKVEVRGFAYREPGMKLDEMVVARFSMTCCTADSAVYGLLTKGEETRQFENDTWLKVTGTIFKTDFDGWQIPTIKPEKIEQIEAPEQPYVYPSFF